MLHLLQMGPFEMLSTLSLQIQNCLKLSLIRLFSLLFPYLKHCNFLLGLLQSVYLCCSIRPSTANTILPPDSRLQTSYHPSAHFVSSPSAPSPPLLAPDCLSTPPAYFYFLTSSGFFAVSDRGALNCYTFFRSILLI